jgi:hypothetical protein
LSHFGRLSAMVSLVAPVTRSSAPQRKQYETI